MTLYFGRSKRTTACVVFIGDSIPAGYNAFGTYGVCSRLQLALPSTVRVLNYCVPGQQTTFDTGTPFYGYTYGMFNGSVLPNLTSSSTKNILVQIGPGNDYARTIPASAADVYAARVDMASRATAVGAVNFICTLPPRNTSYNSSIIAENVFIRAGEAAHNYTMIELYNDSKLGTVPSAYYGDDLGHWSDAGEQRAADIILPYIQALL